MFICGACDARGGRALVSGDGMTEGRFRGRRQGSTVQRRPALLYLYGDEQRNETNLPRQARRGRGYVYRGFLRSRAAKRRIAGGWNGMHVFGQEPRRPEAHSPSLISYLWNTEDPKARIQPGQSLSGFSVQLPAPRKDPPGNKRRPVYPDLSDVSFQVDADGARCAAIGIVELD